MSSRWKRRSTSRFRLGFDAVASAAHALYHTVEIEQAGLQIRLAGPLGHFGRFMRFTSLIIELIRARPRLIVWLVVLSQAALWLILPMLLYQSPSGDLATVLAYGREYQVGTDLGPPLAFWLADIAFRAAGNHMFGVYLLAQLCSIATFWTLYLLARAVVGGQQAVLAVLLTMTVVAFSSPGVEFGPLVLARPLWALLLLHSWQLIGQGRRNAWFAWSIEAGLLLLTTSAAIGLLILVAAFALATARGRRTLMSFDPLFALLVIVVLALPYLIWLVRADTLVWPHWPAIAELHARVLHWAGLLGGLLLAMSGIVLLGALNSGWFGRSADEAPIIFRPPVDPLARDFVYFFAIGPALAGSLISGLFGLDRVAGGTGIALLMSGLAVIVAAGDLVQLRRHRILRSVWAAAIVAPALAVIMTTLFVPWTGSGEVATSLPAAAIAHFFGDSFERRTNHRLPAVAGDAQLATLIALDAGRPHLLLDAAPERTPWLTIGKFNETGGVVVWRASDTVGTPPADVAQRFPGLVPEVPRSFEWLVSGRQPLLRIGWAIVRPKTP
jgi:dolichyl-phosphate-mannose-protein mannosyltransferase